MKPEQPNINYIEQLSGGDKTFESKLITIIKDEFPEELKTYQINLSTKKYKLAADNVHKLKHKISILGLEKSYTIAEGYENDLREGRLDLEKNFSEILVTISDFLDTL